MNHISMAEQEYIWNVGKDRPEQDWILSDRDVWYRNPHYKGIHGPHPEDWDEDTRFAPDPAPEWSDDIPF